MSKQTSTSIAPGQERSLSVAIKSLRNPPLDIKLSSQPLNTSILDIKNSVTQQTSIPADKIKILHKKKPVPDSKVLKDLVAEHEISVEFSVMVLGGAAAVPTAPATGVQAHTEIAQGPSGLEELHKKVFWDDLRGFLLQRLRDEGTTDELFKTFQDAWKAKR